MNLKTLAYRFHLSTTGDSAMPGILLLHGFLGSGKDWQRCAHMLRNHYACFMPDLPGHGATKVLDNKPRTFEDIAGQIAELAGKIHTDPLHLVGYSMGGRLALYLVLYYPGLFRSAVIVSSSPGLKTAEERTLRRASDNRLAESITGNFDLFLDDWYRLKLFESLKNHPFFPEILQKRRENNPEALAVALRQMGTGRQPSLWNKLGNNKLPIRFFVGEKDIKYVEIGRQMVNLCPDSELVVFPGCGHTLHIENTQLFLDRLVEFLSKQ